jgi:hypothetical protein
MPSSGFIPGHKTVHAIINRLLRSARNDGNRSVIAREERPKQSNIFYYAKLLINCLFKYQER